MSYHDRCPHCNQPWERQRRKTVNALAAFCYFCAERRSKGIEWYAARRQAALERRFRPYSEWTDEAKAQAEQAALALWPTRE